MANEARSALEEAIQLAAAQPARNLHDHIYVQVLGPVRAGKTFLLYAWGLATDGAPTGGVKFGAKTRQFTKEWMQLDANVPIVTRGMSRKDWDKALLEKWKSTEQGLPAELPLFEANGSLIVTRDFSGEDLARIEGHVQGTPEFSRSVAKLVGSADAFLLVIDPLTPLSADPQIMRRQRTRHIFLRDIAAILKRSGKPVAVVATKFDEAEIGTAFRNIIDGLKDSPNDASVILDGTRDSDKHALLAAETRPDWPSPTLASEVCKALRDWDANGIVNPPRGTSIVDRLGLDTELEPDALVRCFACSAFGGQPERGPSPIGVMEPLAFLVSTVHRSRKAAQEARDREEQRRSDAARVLAETQRKESERLEAKKKEDRNQGARQRRRAKAHLLAACAASVSALLLLAVSALAWQAGLHLASGQFDRARSSVPWYLPPSTRFPVICEAAAGHRFLLAWGTAAGDRYTEEEVNEWLSEVTRAGASLRARQAAMAVTLGPYRRATNGKLDAEGWLELDRTLTTKAASPEVAPWLDSFARRRIQAARADALLQAWVAMPASSSRSDLAARIEELLDLGAEPLQDDAALRVLSTLLRFELENPSRWKDMPALARRLDDLVQRVRKRLPNDAVSELAGVLISRVAALDGPQLEATFDAIEGRERAAMADASGSTPAQQHFWSTLATLFREDGGRSLVAKWTDQYRREPTSAVASRLAALLEHTFARSVPGGLDRHLYPIAAEKAFLLPGETSLLHAVVQAVLSRTFDDTQTGGPAASLDTADERLLWGLRNESARRRHLNDYEQNLRFVAGVRRHRGWERYLFLANAVDARFPAAALHRELVATAETHKRASVVEIVRAAPAEIERGESVNGDLVVSAMKAGDDAERHALIGAIVQHCAKLPAPLFATVAAAVRTMDARDPWHQVLLVVAEARLSAPPAGEHDVRTRVDAAVAILPAAALLTANVRAMVEDRLRELMGMLLRTPNAAGNVEVAKRVAAVVDADFRLPSDDVPVAARSLEQLACDTLATGDVAGAIALLQKAQKLEPQASQRRMAILPALLGDASRDAAVLDRVLALAAGVSEFEPGFAAEARRLAAPSLELLALQRLQAGDVGAAAASWRQSEQLDAADEACKRRRLLLQQELDALTVDAAMFEHVVKFADQRTADQRTILPPETIRDVRKRVASLLEIRAMQDLEQGNVDAGAKRLQQAIAFDPGETKRRLALLLPLCRDLANDANNARLSTLQDLAKRPDLEPEVVTELRSRSDTALLGRIRRELHDDDKETARSLANRILDNQLRQTTQSHLDLIGRCALCPGSDPDESFFAEIDLVTNADHERWLDKQSPAPPKSSKHDQGHSDMPWTKMPYSEAEAYAASHGGRLPTLAEWKRLVTSGRQRRNLHKVDFEWLTGTKNGNFLMAPHADTKLSENATEILWNVSHTWPNVAIRVVYPLLPKQADR